MIVEPTIPHENQFLQPFSVYFNFGKHQGRFVEELILKEPEYIRWILDIANPRGSMLEVVEAAVRLIGLFDAKPLIKPCRGAGCGKPATRCVVYGQTLSLSFWCNDCDPYSLGAARGMLRSFPGYRDACMQPWGTGNPKELKTLIRDVARAKGLPDRVGQSEAIAFFNQ